VLAGHIVCAISCLTSQDVRLTNVTFNQQVSIPLWALVHLPVVVTLSTAAFTPNGWVHSILYVLFENAMGIVKLGAVIAGRDSKFATPSGQLPLNMFQYSAVG
jgi:hypothetical protein